MEQQIEGNGGDVDPSIVVTGDGTLVEVGVATLAYLAAFALVLAEGTPRERIRALAPHAVITALRATAYVAGGYGARGVGQYRDLAGAPLDTLLAGLADLPIYLPAWSTDYLGRIESRLGKAYSEPAADVRGMVAQSKKG